MIRRNEYGYFIKKKPLKLLADDCLKQITRGIKMKKLFFIISLLIEVTALSFNLFAFSSVEEINKYLSKQNLILSEVDTLYYLADTTKFYDEYKIATEIYNIHTRFTPPESWEYYRIKVVKLLFSTMVIGDTLKKIGFFKDTLNYLVYQQNINRIPAK